MYVAINCFLINFKLALENIMKNVYIRNLMAQELQDIHLTFNITTWRILTLK